MKYEKDKITVIIPVYNVENYLERCLKSILYNTKIQKSSENTKRN